MNALCLVLAVCALNAPTAPLALVEGGQARASIVTPDRPSETVKRAAEELALYIERMSGAKLAIVAESQARTTPRIDMGPTALARKMLPADAARNEERAMVRSTPDGLVICGGGDRGTLFGVYRFLETLGCRWLTPEPENELTPRRTTIVVENVRIDSCPAFQWRLFSGSGKPEQEAWGLKLGFNGLYRADAAGGNGGCYYWPDAVRGCHAYYQIMPAKQYAAAHPQWNPLIGGERVPTSVASHQLCVTAPGLADEFAANVIRVFDADPNARLVSISPNDGHGWCECPECLALDKKLCGGRTTKQGLAKEKPFMGDRVFWFANEVARRVEPKHPDRKLLVLAYVNYAEPPDTVHPHRNVVPWLCHYAPADYSRPIADPSSEPNRQFNALLERWVKITPDLLIYSYVSKSMWWRLPRPVTRIFAADVKHYYDLGVRRYYCQSSLSDWPLDGPLYYVIGKLLWDPAADPQALAAEWTRGMFGPAAADMEAFYAAVEASVRKTGQSYSDNPPRQVPGLYDPAELNRAMAALERAEKKAAGDPPCAARLEKVARTFRYGRTMVAAIERHTLAEANANPADQEAALELGRKALAYGAPAESKKLLDSWSKWARIGVSNQGFGKEETKGGRTCWNSDETGPGDNASGWASFSTPAADTRKPLVVEMDVWGESQLNTLSINAADGVWKSVRPEKRLSKKPQWDTLVFRIPSDLLYEGRTVQRLGFGGADSQIWVARIRCRQP